VLITSSGVMRGSKKIDLKAIADKAVEMAELNDEHLVGGRGLISRGRGTCQCAVSE
jgi:acyl-coenzyme A synthetase/AMP-(fatty) acid ligase